MSGYVMRQMLCLALLLLMGAAGCSSMQTVESTGTAQWSGMGVSLTLPAGFWEVEEVAPGQVVEFRKTASSAHIVLMRVPAREDEQGGLVLRRLFVHFEDKQELARWSRPLRSGVAADFADYMLSVEDRELQVRACAVLHGAWTYELIMWGIEPDAANALADSIDFAN